MEKLYILHMLTPTRNVSPFDVNMAYDAGYDAVVPYTDVTLDQVQPLTQDAIFSRGPSGVKRTGIFLGGRRDRHGGRHAGCGARRDGAAVRGVGLRRPERCFHHRRCPRCLR